MTDVTPEVSLIDTEKKYSEIEILQLIVGLCSDVDKYSVIEFLNRRDQSDRCFAGKEEVPYYTVKKSPDHWAFINSFDICAVYCDGAVSRKRFTLITQLHVPSRWWIKQLPWSEHPRIADLDGIGRSFNNSGELKDYLNHFKLYIPTKRYEEVLGVVALLEQIAMDTREFQMHLTDQNKKNRDVLTFALTDVRADRTAERTLIQLDLFIGSVGPNI